jgi:hypothetical protein
MSHHCDITGFTIGEPSPKIDTTNKFVVCVKRDHVAILNPPTFMTKEEALNLAAYLVTLSFASREEFLAVLDAVEST